ncbi:MAG: dapB [Myxococcales bacterium]|nr:dapB [Myxococcales bacterium]
MGMAELRVGIVGLGPIGLEVARAIVSRRELKMVAAVDSSPSLTGKRLDELVPGAPSGVLIQASLDEALSGGQVEAVALTTTSRFSGITADLEIALKRRVHVVSTCEELAAPAIDPQTWARLDDHAKHADVTLLGTGVNPGFVMDRLPLQLAGACVSVSSVQVERIVDAARRRGPLRKKVGEGLTREEFAAGVAANRIGHVGLRESAVLLARGLHWRLERYDETIEPVLGPDGNCLGIRQRGIGIVGGEERIKLSLDMYVGAPDPHDRVMLAADPPMDVLIAGGTQGDRATVGTTVNALARMRSAPRGLVTVADVFV